jgi:hypothetical protein
MRYILLIILITTSHCLGGYHFKIPKLNFIKKLTLRVKATTYNPGPQQGWGKGNKTASGKFINLKSPEKHRWIAISKDLKNLFEWGDSVRVSGTGVYDGIWYVQDRMAKKNKRKIDFLIRKGMPGGFWKDIIITKE